MKTDEIRNFVKTSQIPANELLAAYWMTLLGEIAAQLSEANHLARLRLRLDFARTIAAQEVQWGRSDQQAALRKELEDL